MNDRRISILVDGGFFLKRLPRLVPQHRCDTPENIANCLRHLFRNHVKALIGDDDQRWHRHIYRNFYYDAVPYDGKAHHPIDNRPLDFSKSDVARKRQELFHQLRRQPKLALRLGKVNKDGDWTISPSLTKKILKTKSIVPILRSLGSDPETSASPKPTTTQLNPDEVQELKRIRDFWDGLETGSVALNLRQKGVDMRIGLDISTLTLKKQVDTIVLVAGDSDFVPAAKLARREGVQVVLDPLWQKVNDDLFEHIDGLQSGFSRPNSTGEILSEDDAQYTRNSEVPDATP